MPAIVPTERCTAVNGPESCRYHKKVNEFNLLVKTITTGKPSTEDLDKYSELRTFLEKPSSIKAEMSEAIKLREQLNREAEKQEYQSFIDSLDQLSLNELENQTTGTAVEGNPFYGGTDAVEYVFKREQVQEMVNLIATALTYGRKDYLELDIDVQGDAYITINNSIKVKPVEQEAVLDFLRKQFPDLEIGSHNVSAEPDRWGNEGTWFMFVPNYSNSVHKKFGFEQRVDWY